MTLPSYLYRRVEVQYSKQVKLAQSV